MTNTVFLAGSIEMDKASRWQDTVCASMLNYAGMIYNPRRSDWDSSWGPGSPELKAQINWELDQLSSADTVFFFFEGGTLSPVSLLELGLAAAWASAGAEMNLIVVCEPTFWRSTNIQETCDYFDIKVHATLAEGLKVLHEVAKRF
jgi:hypothetical protein